MVRGPASTGRETGSGMGWRAGGKKKQAKAKAPGTTHDAKKARKGEWMLV
jgi:hypothetical protein